MSPIFHGAFKTLENTSPPPQATPLLKEPPRMILVSAQHVAEQHSLPDILDTQTTLIHLRPSYIPQESYTIHPSTTIPTSAIYHATNFFDLALTLRHFSPAQRHAIHILRIRWYTAHCALWEMYHPGHTAKTGARALGMLTGLEMLEVECTGKEGWEVRDVKGEMEEWLRGVGLGVQVVIVGGTQASEEKGVKWWGSSVGWGWRSLGG